MKTLIFSYILLLIAILNTVLLAFGYRDFSWSLMGMALLSVLGLPLAGYLLYSHYPQPNVVLATEDEETGKLSHWYQYTNGKEPDDHANGFFKSCH